MSSLYNLRTIPSGFQVTKFDDDFNVESSYEMTQDSEVRCGCPAGARPTCRHRQMFSQLRDRVDTAWFLDFDTRAWVDPTGEAKADYDDTHREAETELKQGLQGSPSQSSISEDTVEIVREAIVSLPDTHPFRRRM